MTPAAWLVARRALLDRPWRSALLLLGYGTGVAIMIVLLSIGDALLDQARDRNLVAGGDVVVLPDGVDPAVIKVNGVTGLFLTIPNARFVVRSVLGGPRFHSTIAAAAPQLSDRLVYLRVGGRITAATASAGIPSLDRAARAARAVAGGADAPADLAWLDPSVPALAGRLDRFHTPSADRSAWAEWDYFNVIDPRSGTHAYVTVLAGGRGEGAIIARVRRPGASADDVVLPVRFGLHDLSANSADQRLGPARVRVDGRGYLITIDDPRLRVDLRVRPDRGFALPPTELRQGSAISGYVVPVVRGRADGTIATRNGMVRLSNAPAYHDHNWGTWRDVTWEWGEASSVQGAYVYGSVHLPAGERAESPPELGTLFVWSAAPGVPARAASPEPADALREERGGLVAALPVIRITYGGWRPGPPVGGRRVPAPGEITVRADNGPDSVVLTVAVWDALGSRPLGAAPGGSVGLRPAGQDAPRRVFLQLRGNAHLRGTIDGRPVDWRGPAASETFVQP